MRIIAGTARSLPLKTIPGQDTRPTTDKIKETLFNMLAYDIPGCAFLDLFAGSGQIGLEAISRGAEYAVFVENSRKAAKCIADNIAFTHFTDQTRLMVTDVRTALLQLEGQMQFDIIFMDPPYGKGYEKEVLEMISSRSILKPHGYIIVEELKETDFSYQDQIGLELYKVKNYRTNAHYFFKRREDA